MKLPDAIDLIKGGIVQDSEAEVWADLGAGSGTFTLALASLLKDGSMIYAMDKNTITLDSSASSSATIIIMEIDFLKKDIAGYHLDGILMANALHFVADKASFIGKLKKNLKPSGRFILVEYDFDSPSHWVPHPVSFESLKQHKSDWGFTSITKIGERPSIYQKAKIYSAVIAF